MVGSGGPALALLRIAVASSWVGCGPEPVAPPGTPSEATASTAPGSISSDDVLLVASLDCDSPFVRYADADGDGEGDADVAVEVCEEVKGFVATAADCDDLRSDISPLAEELCEDGLDNNCDGFDATCPPPDLSNSAIAFVRTLDSDGFGTTIVGGLVGEELVDRWAVVGAPNAAPLGVDTEEAGALYELAELEGFDVGARVEFELAQRGETQGQWRNSLGRALARASTGGDEVYERLYAGTAGPVDTAMGTASCGVFWFDVRLPSGGDFAEGADGFVPCDLTGVDGVASSGIEAVAAGFWSGEGDVMSAYYPAGDYFWVVVNPDGGLGDVLPSIGVRLNDAVGEDLGNAMAWTDLDGDGLDDLIATAPSRSTAENRGGGFDVFLGDELVGMAPGAEFDVTTFGFGIAADIRGEQLGQSVAVGDLDGDGVADIILGGQQDDTTVAGTVLLVSIADVSRHGHTQVTLDSLPTSTTYTRIQSDELADYFGFAVAMLDPDGLAIGAPTHSELGGLDGRVYTIAPSTDLFGATSHSVGEVAATTYDTDTAGEAFGYALSTAGDLDDDGSVDLWATAPGGSSTNARAILILNTGL